MFSPIEILAVLVVGLILITVVIGGGGIMVYMVMRKAAQDGARDVVRTGERQPPK